MDNKKINIEGIKRSNIHQVPDGYFDALPLKIQTRINANKPPVHVFTTKMQNNWNRIGLIYFLLWR